MAVEVAVVQGTTPTSSGSNNFTSSGFGAPTAAIVVISYANTTNNPQDKAAMGVGFIDVAADIQHAMGFQYEQNRSTTNTMRSASITRCAIMPSSVVGTAFIQGDFTTTVTDGITINWTMTTSVAMYVTVYLIKGTTNVHVGSTGLGTGTTKAVTAPGFEPHFVFTTNVGYGIETNVATDAGLLAFGASHNLAAGAVNHCIYTGSQDNVSNSTANTMVRNDACSGQLYADSNAYNTSCGSFGASGWTYTSTSNPGSDYIYHLAIEGDSEGDFYLDIIDTHTAVATKAYTGVGFQPGFLMLGQSVTDAVNTVYSSGGAATSIAIGGADGTNQYSSGIADEDGQAETDTESYTSTTQVAQLKLSDGTLEHAATLDSFDADGFTLDFTTTDTGTARKWMAIAFGGAATDWNTQVRDKEVVGSVVRTSDTVVTITLSAAADFDSTGTTTVTATIPGAALTGGSPLVASPTFQVTSVTSGFQAAWARNSNVLIQGGIT